MQQVIENMKPDIDSSRWFMVANVDLHALKVKSFTLARECNDMVKTAKAEKRDLTNEEYRRWEELVSQYEIVEAQISSQEADGAYGNAMLRGVGRRTTAQGPSDVDYSVDPISPRAQQRESRAPAGALIVGRTKEGQLIRGYRKGESLPVSGPALPFDFGMWMKAAYRGDWDSIRAEAVQQEGVGGDGGFTVPTRMAAEIINSVKNKAVMMGLATTVKMDTNALDMAKVVSPAVAYWRGELGVIPTSKVTFEGIHLRAHSLGALIKSSEELLADSVNMGPLLQDEISSALALALDQAILTGDGVGKPLGIFNSPGVQSVSAVGTLASYAPFSQAWTKLLAANHTPSDLVMNALTAGKIDQLVDGDDNALRPPNSWSQFSHLVTNQIAQEGTTSTALMLDASDSNLVVGMRQEVRVEFSKAGVVDGVEAFSQVALLIRATMRVDVAIIRPLAFCLIPGTTTTP